MKATRKRQQCIDMAVKKKKAAKVIPFPSRPRKVVRAAKVEYRFATCPECGNKIKLEPGPLLKSSGLHFVLVAVMCPKCHSEVRLGGETEIIPPPRYD
jgi:rRNA maturation protein Nop10